MANSSIGYPEFAHALNGIIMNESFFDKFDKMTSDGFACRLRVQDANNKEGTTPEGQREFTIMSMNDDKRVGFARLNFAKTKISMNLGTYKIDSASENLYAKVKEIGGDLVSIFKSPKATRELARIKFTDENLTPENIAKLKQIVELVHNIKFGK